MLKAIDSSVKYVCQGNHEKSKLVRRVDSHGLGIWYECRAGDYSLFEPSELCKKIWREQGWSEGGVQANKACTRRGAAVASESKNPVAPRG